MPDVPVPTRERIWREIQREYGSGKEAIAVWCRTNVIAAIPDDEWQAMHAGTCELCGSVGRLYPCGWRCENCKPGRGRTDA
jgi:hypothetical protein